MEIIFFDLETTGVDTNTARIVSLCMVKVQIDFLLGPVIVDKKNLLINPTIPIPKEASDVHGITNEMVVDKPLFSQYAKSIYNYLGETPLGGFNIINYDIPLLIEEFHRCGISWNPGPIIDSCTIFKEKEKRDLTSAVKFYCDKEMNNAHDAEADVLATIDVFHGQYNKYGMSAEDCIEFCKNPDALDLAGKIILKDGIACYNVGKAKGTAVKSDRGFGMWMLKQPYFTRNTKNIVNALIASS